VTGGGVVLICYEDANDAVMNKFISYRQGQATHTDTGHSHA